MQVKWVNKGVERGETLVSISTDGRVVEWSMKKGLSFSPLMVLKRIGEGVCARRAVTIETGLWYWDVRLRPIPSPPPDSLVPSNK